MFRAQDRFLAAILTLLVYGAFWALVIAAALKLAGL